ncbi:hypothetical protein WIS52_27125 [Pseudonocardia nematodicida]|uniref:Lipoprotein n=1 Tax=Pseudonocardia nematodicida TaxID=1206997 RepID=A0ABV1KI74_9PSEU
MFTSSAVAGSSSGHRATRRARSLVLLVVTLAACALLASCAPAPEPPAEAAPGPPAPPPPSAAPAVPELPGGGTELFPGRRLVALYGHPGTPAMGVLGEQDVTASIARAKDLAADYQPLVDEPVVPAFEIIATVADTAPGPDGDYTSAMSVDELRPWVDEAERAGVYVVLDLQPGRADFGSQAQRYTELLTRPHVGLALDPEWRLEDGQQHGDQVGSVDATEVNETADWLAGLVREHDLPQKVFLLHQFQVPMITDRQDVVTDRPELATVLHADGFGTPQEKIETWNTLHTAPGPDGLWWGWKNFIDEDSPTFTPQQTFDVRPESPVFVSYQ